MALLFKGTDIHRTTVRRRLVYDFNLKAFKATKKPYITSASSWSFERASTPGQTQTGLGQSLSFYYPKLLYYPDQMLAVMLLSQQRVSSYKT